jgi:hypothetical protein
VARGISEKFAQNVSQPIFWTYYYISFTEEKSCPRLWTNSVIFIKLAKVNNRPMGENSPNLVTLLGGRLKLTDEGLWKKN